MADSLRDQLIAAGFEAPKKPPAKKKGKPRKTANPGKSGKTKSNQLNKDKANPNKAKNKSAQTKNTEDPQAVLERKKLKAQIQVLIDENKVEDFKGEVTYRYLVEKRIREMYVNEDTHKKLTTREISITRLNGTPNPKDDPEDDDYAEFQVPDDLKW